MSSSSTIDPARLEIKIVSGSDLLPHMEAIARPRISKKTAGSHPNGGNRLRNGDKQIQLFIGQAGNTGQLLAFQIFEAGTAPCGDVRNLVLETGFFDG